MELNLPQFSSSNGSFLSIVKGILTVVTSVVYNCSHSVRGRALCPYTITACLRDTMEQTGYRRIERSLKGLMQGSLRNYDGENCVST